MDSRIYYLRELTKFLDKIKNDSRELLTNKRIVDSVSSIFTEDGIDYNRLLELDNQNRYFLLNALGENNAVAATDNIKRYVSIINSGNSFLLLSPQFLELKSKIEVYKEKYQSLLSESKEVSDTLNSLEKIINILNGNIDSSIAQIDGYEILGTLNHTNLLEKEKTDVLLIAFDIISNYLNDQVNKKREEKNRLIEENKKKVFAKSSKINKEKKKQPNIKEKSLITIKSAINDSSIQEIINNSGIHFEDIEEMIYDYLVESSVDLRSLTTEIVIENIKKAYQEDIRNRNINNYKLAIESSFVIKNFINNYFDNKNISDIATLLSDSGIELNENAIKKHIKSLFIEKLKTTVNTINTNLNAIEVLVNEDGEELFDYTISKELVTIGKQKLNDGYNLISENVDLLLSPTQDLSEEEYEKLMVLSNCYDTINKVKNELYHGDNTEDLRNDEMFVLIAEEVVNELSKMNLTQNNGINNHVNPFNNILFLDDAIVNQIESLETANNYRQQVEIILSDLDKVGLKESGLKVTVYHLKDGNKAHKKLKENDVKEVKRQSVRVFVREVPKDIGGYKYIIVYVCKKGANNTDQTKNATDAANFLTGKEERLKELVEITNDENRLAEELEKQSQIASNLNVLFDTKRM